MKDHIDLLPSTIKFIKEDIEVIKEQGYRDGGTDATLNYLHFLRDEINAQIKKAKKESK